MTGTSYPERVLVTGGSSGIGKAIAIALAERGTSVLVAARHTDTVQSTVDALPGTGHQAFTLDVSDNAAWSRAVADIRELGPLDGLVTAAGILGPIGLLDEVDPAEFRAVIEINLLGTVLALHHCLPLLRANHGAAVTFSGGGSTSPLPRFDAYAASKAAVVRLTENVARAADPSGVRINCVAPGFVATRMHEETLAAGADRVGNAYYERTVQSLAEGGVPPETAAELVCFLLSTEARGISGKLISAPWDAWRDADFQGRLRADPDLATLRRIDEQFFRAQR